MNLSYLNHQKYKDGIIKLVQETMRDYSELKSKRLYWELLKIRIKEFSISYAVHINKERKGILKRLKKNSMILMNGLQDSLPLVTKFVLLLD